MMRRYAEDTRVPVPKSRAEIEQTLQRYGAKAFAFSVSETKATIMFEANDRRVRFDMNLPAKSTSKDEQEKRRLWRSLLLCIKSRLESVASGIESFEEAFLSHVVMPDGKTVYQHTRPVIADSYKGGTMLPLLSGPKE